MATSKVQRWGIMTILIVTVVGTLGSFAVMVLSMQNQQRIQADYEKVNNEYQTQLKAYKAKVQMSCRQNITIHLSSTVRRRARMM